TWPLQPLPELRGLVKAARFPREAMGFGDVKLMAMIGAFTGWTGVLFTIPSASMLGSAYGLIATMLGRRELSAKIPFGPYLSLGALLWIYMAPSILDWYRRTLLGF
ncbi:MAG: prepilin peptidase, partial [Verrucomicrobia bacterium]|nr:prepilin peptidase [Verrucomicrobiota bacterium]